MRCFIDYLKKEGADLAKEIGVLKKELKETPEGRLEIKKNRSRVQYYYKSKNDNQGKKSGLKYIKNDKKQLAKCGISG